ncbi:MAG TPA: TetR family transcriptional regulator [Solirubrobacteraceae bacterium]|jgi:AcrR family transcriptional regulator|nr:TetR family transcriptional regulator [Solirubrobacteraceae bacterium]
MRLANVQRARILAALIGACAEHGIANISVSNIVTRAGVSRRTFYELFANYEECLLAALENSFATAAAPALEAYQAQRGWREQIRAALQALLGFFEEQPQVGRLLVVESLGAGPRVLEHRARVLAQIAGAIDEGRTAGRAGAALPLFTAEGVLGGVLAVMHRRMLEPEPRLLELAGPLMGMIALPYLGAAAARREAERPVALVVEAKRAEPNPLANLDIRVTYRTMRVLAAIGAQPDSSNRQVGRVAEIEDQGQVSKLLQRLKRVGLIENAGEGGKGSPNAWQLTGQGRAFLTVTEPAPALAPGSGGFLVRPSPQPFTSLSSAATSRSFTPSSGAGTRLPSS